MIPLLIGLGVLIVVVIAVLMLRKKPSKIVGADAYRSLLGVAQPTPPAASDDNPVLHELRQNLRVKLLYQEDKIDAAIAFERERNPTASLESLMHAAIERWERDNR